MEEKNRRILVVDDEQDVNTALKRFLGYRHYDVTVASSGEQALDILKDEGFDVVLLDLFLFGISGGLVASVIKKKYPATKVVMITGYPDESAPQLQNLQIDAFLTKPINIEDLYTKLQQV